MYPDAGAHVYNACLYDACTYDLQSLTLIHICLMLDHDACIHDAYKGSHYW